MSQQAIYTILVIAICTAITIFVRAVPFLLFGRGEMPAVIRYLSQVLPAAIMIILVIYCLKDTNWSGTTHGAPELIAVAATAGIHIWKKNMYLSIIVGTVCYMVLIRTVFRG